MTKAGEELCVTQVAISRQVAFLEKALRTSLFERGGKRLQLSPAGEVLFLTLTRMFVGATRTTGEWSRGTLCHGMATRREERYEFIKDDAM